ncbi:MAG: hypothetical protein L6416_09895 [Candidatus Omnitrophica bacterium]|nr:hypothetical protein [Candidatus Omnitrophota bacterium]
MRLINLLPEELQVKKNRQFLIITPEIARLILAAVVITVFLLAWRLVLSSKLDEIKVELAGIEASWKATEELVKERGNLLEQKKEAEEAVIFLRRILSRDIFWSERFNQLIKITPIEMWFEELVLEKEDNRAQLNDNMKFKRSLRLSAHVGFLSTDDEILLKINRFIEDIKESKDFYQNFKDLTMLDLRKGSKAEEHMINFKIKMDLKE